MGISVLDLNCLDGIEGWFVFFFLILYIMDVLGCVDAKFVHLFLCMESFIVEGACMWWCFIQSTVLRCYYYFFCVIMIVVMVVYKSM
ncbi:hypothetical protein L1887_39121 [Cichorium endivia]|nr:hypothetical protein L1887_39121 [Cichorium endivia]